MMDKEVFTCVRSHVATAAYDEDKNKQEAFYQCRISCGDYGYEMMDKEVFTSVRSHVATAAYDEDKNKQEASYQCEISCGT